MSYLSKAVWRVVSTATAKSHVSPVLSFWTSNLHQAMFEMSSNLKSERASPRSIRSFSYVIGQIYFLRRVFQAYYILLLLGIISLCIDHACPIVCVSMYVG